MTTEQNGKISLSDALGKPHEGFHSARMPGDLAVNDVVGTFAIAAMVSVYFDMPLWKSAIGLFALAEVSHFAFGVDTAVVLKIKSLYSSSL